MKSVPVNNAVGRVLCHDVTRIVPGRHKEPAFKKGHFIAPQDIEPLLDMGKANVYVYDLSEGYIHEDDAARRIASAAAGPGLQLTSPSEGRVNLKASLDGLLKVNREALKQINSVEDIVFATLQIKRFISTGGSSVKQTGRRSSIIKRMRPIP